MTEVAPSFADRRPSRRGVMIVAMTVAVIAAALYYPWRVVSAAPPAPGTEADTLCMAGRIGLPCR